MTTTESSIQHPVLRIQGLISELKDATTGVDYETEKIHEMLDELESLMTMIATKGPGKDAYMLARYQMIAAIVSAPDPNEWRRGNANSDSTDRRGDRDRGGGQGRDPGDGAGQGPRRSDGPEALQDPQG